MRTVVLGPRPAELDALIARRRALGLDIHDEVWKGEYHMAPAPHSSHGYLLDEVVAFLRPIGLQLGLCSSSAFNLGDPDDFRVPDWALHRRRPVEAWVPTAAVVVEIESPDDETWEKLGFYADHGVEELLIVSNANRSITWLMLEESGYVQADHSRILGEASRQLVLRIDWSPIDDATS